MTDKSDNETGGILAIVPARGGSKGLPGKNIMDLCGKPLIAWTIEAALGASAVDRVIVSTDDNAIAEVSRKYGAEVPFMRPAELATDESPSIDLVLHALGWLEDNEGYRPDVTMLLQPTSPLRTWQDINDAMKMMQARDLRCICGVALTPKSPYWMKRIDEQGRLIPLLPDSSVATRRQDLPEVYMPNGAMFAAETQYLLDEKSFYTDETAAYIMNRESLVDIDDEVDMKIAQCLLRERLGKS